MVDRKLILFSRLLTASWLALGRLAVLLLQRREVWIVPPIDSLCKLFQPSCLLQFLHYVPREAFFSNLNTRLVLPQFTCVTLCTVRS